MDINKLSPRLTLQLTKNHTVIIEEKGVWLLILISRFGSILAASKKIGMPYSRAWEYISRIERLMGIQIIDAKRGGRGGGGTKLTEEGWKLVRKYLSEYRRRFGREFDANIVAMPLKIKAFTYAGSNDIVLEHIFGIMRKEEFPTEIYWIGSLRGLASILLDECDLTGMHLLNPDTGKYNVDYIRKYTPTEDIVLIRGYERETGFITREELNYEDVLDLIFRKKLRIINRNKGSGTRLLIDSILRKEAIERGIKAEDIKKEVDGYDEFVYTHIDTARKIASGEADIGIGLKTVSQMYKLRFIHITWEKFDFATRLEKLSEKFIKKFIETLKCDEVGGIIQKYDGYRADTNIGKIIKM